MAVFNNITVAQLLAIPGTRCPIGGGFMRDPALLAGTGLSYERTAIATHLAVFGTDPETGVVLTVQEQRLFQNPALKGLIQDILGRLGLHVGEEIDAEAQGPSE